MRFLMFKILAQGDVRQLRHPTRHKLILCHKIAAFVITPHFHRVSHARRFLTPVYHPHRARLGCGCHPACRTRKGRRNHRIRSRHTTAHSGTARQYVIENFSPGSCIIRPAGGVMMPCSVAMKPCGVLVVGNLSPDRRSGETNADTSDFDSPMPTAMSVTLRPAVLAG